jgi:diguanylate cyclase (GGDEF)-like protein/PAS domain S-box-containing protein
MFNVIECVWEQHDRGIVLLAAAIWLLGSYSFFLALHRAEECRADRRSSWLGLGAIAGGLGVWATHFVAMLAYEGGMPIDYTFALTLVSAGISVAGFWAALAMLRDFSPARVVLSGVTTAAGVALMHFCGMAAVRVQAHIQYDWFEIGVGCLVAATCFSAAFFMFGRLSGKFRIHAAALASIVAVCALHFTGMSATTLQFDPTMPPVEVTVSREWLIGAIVISTMLVALLTVVSTVIDRYLTDLRGFADATLEGVAIVRDGRIIEANGRFSAMIGARPADIAGADPEDWLAASDALPIATLRDKPVEASPKKGGAERVLEIAVQEIEYRGRASQVLAVRDLTDAKAAQRQIEHLARHDGLTGLPNRRLFQERLEHALALSRRNGDSIALLALDLDRFKAVNDLFGHGEGDVVLKRVSTILKGCVRGADTVARIGGDEFVILQVGAAQPEGARGLAGRILERFREEMNPAMDPTAVGVSIGVALHPRDAVDAEALHHAADIALYRAKTGGRGAAAFFDERMDIESRQRRQLESDLRHAITRNQLSLVYQPLVSVSDSRISGYEALLRWKHPERGDISPEEFIPIAEDTGAILSLGEWVLRKACAAAAAWAEPLTLAVNISAIQFQVATFEDMVVSALAESGLSPDRLELEITETALMKDRQETIRVLHALKQLGVHVVMDDFGTGYSSLSNLQSFPFDKIKIDRSFIQSMANDEAARSIIRAIVGIGRSLALPVVAEGVETAAQREMVEQEGCPQAQGYFFGRPGAGPQMRQTEQPSPVRLVS